MTSLPLIIAEELDADWTKVRIVPAPPNEDDLRQSGLRRHDVHRRLQRGDRAITGRCGPSARRCAACCSTMRRSKLGVPVEELTTEPSVVVHAKSGRKLSYGDIAAFAEVPAKAPEIKPEQLKKPADFRLIGKDVMRVELPSKVNGTRNLRHRRPGAGHAVRRRAARAGRRIGPGQDRRCQGEGGGRASRPSSGCRTASAWSRETAVGGVRGARRR